MSNQGGLVIGRSRNGDRFYSAPPVRRHKQKLLQKQKEEQRIRSLGGGRGGGLVESSSSEKKSREGDDCASSSSVSTEVDSGCSVSRDDFTNLDQFLECITPSVKPQFSPKTNKRELKNHVEDLHPHYILGDLWESYQQWSAYGVGVPILLNDSEAVVQYYVPYLSGIQLYVDQSKPSDAESSIKLTCNGIVSRVSEMGASDALNEPMSKLNLTGSNSPGHNTHSLQKETLLTSGNGECEITTSPGQLMFEYLERDPPFGREPLADKITSLTSSFPQLGAYRSCDLMPSSWVSVAWYPIYRIPTGSTLQNLEACFLTFHSLSTPSKSISTDKMKLSLPVFGLASYKYKVSVWNPNGISEKANSLLLAADNWLKHLKVYHPDYIYFISHSPYSR